MLEVGYALEHMVRNDEHSKDGSLYVSFYMTLARNGEP